MDQDEEQEIKKERQKGGRQKMKEREIDLYGGMNF